jgi:hypothetical protein
MGFDAQDITNGVMPAAMTDTVKRPFVRLMALRRLAV